ncbi:hypothetical protein BCR39DRAFT_494779 [Naematelia encephala]|uniref:SMP-30/Gluconolactonase/LRE-like region domain-containing protein n=1 Tax=Naematelia encephala TaxID=71784 RepID=A0A1Y2B5R1_9TREE|nr:hypothetical protein BCR39DRAFT_494779 [Naematelia encephala]
MMRQVSVDEPLLRVGNTLGEACVWDARTQRLYFVDIDQRKIFTYEPSSGIYGYQVFERKISSIAVMEDGTGLVAAIEAGFAYVDFSSLPFPPTGKPSSMRLIIDTNISFTDREQRFNEATVDPAGRFLGGTMGFNIGDSDSKLYALTVMPDGRHQTTLMLKGIGCSNGMAWSLDHQTMYFTDSWVKEIYAFDYDLKRGTMSNRRSFHTFSDPYGYPDGMCMDTEGGIWSACWSAGKVIRIAPQGKVDVVIDFPTAWHMTCCIFGAGPDLKDLYVTSANSAYTGSDLDSPDRHDGGSLFVVRGLGYRGLERNKFRGASARD